MSIAALVDYSATELQKRSYLYKAVIRDLRYKTWSCGGEG